MKIPKQITVLILFISLLFVFRYVFSVIVIHYVPQVKWSNETASQEYTVPNSVLKKPPVINPADLWLKWDSLKYMDIAQHGYEAIPYEDTKLHNWAFYPLYPLIVRIIPSVFGFLNNTAAVFITGIIISSLFYLLSLIALKKLINLLHLNRRSLYSVIILIAAFPAAYFFQMFYPESLFLFLSIIFFYSLFKKQYILSALFLSLALIDRPNALVMTIPFFFYFGIHERKKILTFIVRSLGYALIIFTPLLFFFYHLYLKTGEFFASFKIQKAWNNEGFTPFGYFITYLKVYGPTFRPEHILSVLLLLGLIFGSIGAFFYFWKRRTIEFSVHSNEITALFLYAFGYIFLLASMKNLSSTFRHTGANFAFFLLPVLLFHIVPKKRSLLFTITISVLLQLFFFILFLTLVPIYGF